MTEKLVAMSPPASKSSGELAEDSSAVQHEAGRLLKSVTKLVTETALGEAENRAPGV